MLAFPLTDRQPASNRRSILHRSDHVRVDWAVLLLHVVHFYKEHWPPPNSRALLINVGEVRCTAFLFFVRFRYSEVMNVRRQIPYWACNGITFFCPSQSISDR